MIMRVLRIDRENPPEQEVVDLLRQVRELPSALGAMPVRSKHDYAGKRDGALVVCPLGATARSSAAQFAAGGWRVACFPTPDPAVLDRPIIILGAPRSGTTLLFELLAQLRCAWTVGRESHGILESIDRLRPPYGADSHRLVERDADDYTAARLRLAFAGCLRDRDGRLYAELQAGEAPAEVRLIEKTPRNSLRVLFLRKVFPGCRFLFLHRDPHENIASLIEGWNSSRYVSCEFSGRPWSFLLPPGWRTLSGAPVEEVAAFQWRTANQYCLDDLASLSREEWLPVRYADLVARTEAQTERICEFAALPWDSDFGMRLRQPLRPSSSVLSPPSAGKWRDCSAGIDLIIASVTSLADRLAPLRSVA